MKNHILIIGGSSGIGLALAKEIASDHDLYIASRSSEKLKGLACTYIPFDVNNDIMD